MRMVFATFVAVGCLVGPLGAQDESPFAPPKPLGGPIVMPDGRIVSALDQVKSPWSGALELGLNGSEGNTQILKIRVGADLKYDTPDDVFMLNGWYGLARQNGIQNENKALLTARNEMPIDDRWGWYVQGQLEYDEFRAVDWRIALHTGLTYTIIKNADTLLKVRAGAGAAREFGGPSDNWLPEAQFGFDFEQKLTERTKFILAADYYPDISDWARFRIRARSAIEIMLDPELNLCARFGVQERYDSRPGPSKRNDLDYFVTLVLKF